MLSIPIEKEMETWVGPVNLHFQVEDGATKRDLIVSSIKLPTIVKRKSLGT
jgi:hypothetical protein